MVEKRKILIQLDSDTHPSVFDRVVAVDAGVDEQFSYGGVKPEDVRDLIFGAIFTRGVKELRNTAVFIGGSDVSRGEAMLAAATASFFGPLRVSLMLDANGANTTAAAAVLAAGRECALSGAVALVLGGTRWASGRHCCWLGKGPRSGWARGSGSGPSRSARPCCVWRRGLGWRPP
jgi:hypothetical protein